ncbi:hypothetical protein [Microbacterium sp. NIBRBAC000506063]|uniref:hypothetical protein n=1 Tax=Microbacterium sp. NIBRBAC000506063 TaxID=2734618 RepID=UPI001CB72578|nr:hypothetical protein [Microbacterium sp. NIBRBAC000506063]
MRKITLKDGPLKGKTVLVHETQTSFTTHAAPGRYDIGDKGAKWTPAAKSAAN